MEDRSSTLRVVHKICPDCGGHHYKDPLNFSDFAETVEGYVLQSTCEDCGLMQPNLREDEDYITNDEGIGRWLKKRVAMKIGRSHGIDPNLSKKLLESFRETYIKKDFITNFSEAYHVLFGIEISAEEIKSFM